MYPKVFDEFYKFKKFFGDVWVLPTTAFYYPLNANEEIIITLDRGKNLLVRFLYISEPNDEGIRDVFFKINGQTRSVAVKDASIQVNKEVHYKVQSENEIGATLQGKLIAVLVNEGDEVKKNQPLFTVEAMKMESTITAPHQGKIIKVYLKSGVLIEQDDCVVAFG
jgi:pyruvate carboxylase